MIVIRAIVLLLLGAGIGIELQPLSAASALLTLMLVFSVCCVCYFGGEYDGRRQK